jgi:hypothetical protein
MEGQRNDDRLGVPVSAAHPRAAHKSNFLLAAWLPMEPENFQGSISLIFRWFQRTRLTGARIRSMLPLGMLTLPAIDSIY